MQHRTFLIIFPLIFRRVIIALALSTGGQGVDVPQEHITRCSQHNQQASSHSRCLHINGYDRKLAQYFLQYCELGSTVLLTAARHSDSRPACAASTGTVPLRATLCHLHRHCAACSSAKHNIHRDTTAVVTSHGQKKKSTVAEYRQFLHCVDQSADCGLLAPVHVNVWKPSTPKWPSIIINKCYWNAKQIFKNKLFEVLNRNTGTTTTRWGDVKPCSLSLWRLRLIIHTQAKCRMNKNYRVDQSELVSENRLWQLSNLLAWHWSCC